MLLLRDRVLLAALALSLCLLGAAGWIIAAPGSPPPAETAPLGLSGLGSGAASATATTSGSLVVDVEGAVARPGIIELPVGSRVADALRAAGGYTDATDLAAAAAGLNLAAPLTDGAQILVPVKGAAPSGGGTASGGGGGAGGLVNLNTATPEELDALPGIGPVTVQKIVAARTERPFASLEEAVERDALDNGQLEKIRDLATV
jgi:competence protein ComEA